MSVFCPAGPMLALSLPAASRRACTKGMPRQHRSRPTAACSRSASKVLNMNWMHRAALRRSAGSSASAWWASSVTITRSNGVCSSSVPATRTAARSPATSTIAASRSNWRSLAEPGRAITVTS